MSVSISICQTEESASEYQEIMSDSGFGIEESQEEEVNYDLTHTLICLQLLNVNEALFNGDKGEEFKQKTNQLVTYYRENQSYFDEIVVHEQNQERENARKEWNDWNPEELALTFENNNEVHVAEEEVSYVEVEEEIEVIVIALSDAEREQEKAKELEESIVINDIYRQKTFNQAESNFQAAEILAKNQSSNAQAIFYYQQAAELYIKGAYLCRNEYLTCNVSFGTLHHSHRLATIVHALTNDNDPAFQSLVRRFEAIGRLPNDTRPLCVRARYLDINPNIYQEQEPCAFYQESDVETARACVPEIAAYCKTIHENLKSTREGYEESLKDVHYEAESISQKIINFLNGIFNQK